MTLQSSGERYAFIVTVPDPSQGIVWQYMLMYYLADNTLEMYDMKNKRTFLKRCPYPSVRPEHLYVGSIVTVYSRQLTVVDYADEFTRSRLQSRKETTLAMIKPDAFKKAGEILKAVQDDGFIIAKLRMCLLSKHDAEEFYEEHRGKAFYDKLTSFISSGPVIAMQLVRDGGIAAWRKLIGPTNSETARAEAPSSLRARFGTDGSFNAVHGSDAPESAARECAFFFGTGPKKGSLPCMAGASLLAVRPHALQDHSLGSIMTKVMERGFGVAGMELFNIDTANAAEFLEVYRGVVPEYNAQVEELTSGPLVAMQLLAPGGGADNSVQALRELCGPPDPEIARVLRPESLRAQFGVDKVKAAVHCTDLPEDGELEVNYFFGQTAY